MISVRALTKLYGDFTAVRDVSFDVGAGEILGLVGPNGAGKTTTLRTLAGILKPTAGINESFCHCSIDQAGIEVSQSVVGSESIAKRAFAGSRRSIDGDDHARSPPSSSSGSKLRESGPQVWTVLIHGTMSLAACSAGPRCGPAIGPSGRKTSGKPLLVACSRQSRG